jgi:signal transduction histidine kinase/CheY-like chemotaxis protein
LRQGITRNHVPVASSDLPLARALRGEEVQGDELEIPLPRGTISALFGAAPFLDDEGHVSGAVASFADITELKRVQRELDLRRREAEEASVRKTRFLSAVSHDIRTPANAINLMAELIRRASTSDELQKELPNLAERLQANTRSLIELVGDLLDVARFDSGRVELVESQFLLGDLIADECRQLSLLAEAKEIQLISEPLERPIRLFSDRVKLGRVIGNLLGNAIKFTRVGTVHISAGFMSPVDRRVMIRVQDTGPGIAPENLARIFDEFAQLHNPERDSSKGFGLGLTICKRLIEVMGGEIIVESQLGQGSAFTIVLPTSAVVFNFDHVSVTPETPAPAAVNGSRLNLNVLLVEDHTATRKGTAELLRQEGAQVREAANGHEAYHALAEQTPDVLLLDMMLPDIDGREILAHLQSKPLPGLKGVVVLTGDLTKERLADVQRLGADALIGKPIDLAKLLTAIEGFQA